MASATIAAHDMEEAFLATRHSLVQCLSNLEDQRTWQEFFETYWRLIYSVARRAGLNAFEAEEAVQETIIQSSAKFPISNTIPMLERFVAGCSLWPAGALPINFANGSHRRRLTSRRRR